MVSAKIVGELACQQNSYLYELQTKVVSCVEVVSSKADTKRTKKNKEKDQKTQSTTTNGDDTKLWEVECEDSVLFPEGVVAIVLDSLVRSHSFRWGTTHGPWHAHNL